MTERVLYHAVYKGSSLFDEMFSRTMVVTHSTNFNPNPEDALVLWGGEDINPSFYGQNNVCHDKRVFDSNPRDHAERGIIDKAIETNIPIIGICRGAEWLCISAGGSLIQDVTNHYENHDLTLVGNTQMQCNSIHHQMMRLKGTDHQVLGWCVPRSEHYLIDEKHAEPVGKIEFLVEPEIVFFPTLKGLAMQFHPEMGKNSALGQLAKNLVAEYFFAA